MQLKQNNDRQWRVNQLNSDNHVLAMRDAAADEDILKTDVWHQSVTGVAKGNYMRLKREEEIKRWKDNNKTPHKWTDGVTEQVLLKEQLFSKIEKDKNMKLKIDLDMHMKMRE